MQGEQNSNLLSCADRIDIANADARSRINTARQQVHGDGESTAKHGSSKILRTESVQGAFSGFGGVVQTAVLIPGEEQMTVNGSPDSEDVSCSPDSDKKCA